MLSTRKSTKAKIQPSNENYTLDDEDSEKYQKHFIRKKRRNQQIFLVCFATTIIVVMINEYRRDQFKAIWNSEPRFLNRIHYDFNSKISTGKYRWADERMLPPLPGEDLGTSKMMETLQKALKLGKKNGKKEKNREDFRIDFGNTKSDWEDDAEAYEKNTKLRQGPKVDYTKWKYTYPDLLTEVPSDGSYPPLQRLGDIMKNWPQDDVDNPPEVFHEGLLHFDYMNLNQRAAAVKFRDYELPFKVYNVPELVQANLKWTDTYVASHFDTRMPMIHGSCSVSDDNFFSFFRNQNWKVEVMGPPPSMDTDFSFEKWAKHARYADNVSLEANAKHLYWQSGVPKTERNRKESHWSFVSKDLPSFSDPEPTFFGFNPPEQKGIQCRFGERGVTAATHYDAGRNMVAMITGAKRYILSPPKECSKLGIIAEHKHPAFRHSLLNFEHLNLIAEGAEINDMSDEERSWLEISYDSLSVDTILKSGEVLYIPSHWFHYITSLQKSAQCNTRSGRNTKGSKEFGGFQEIRHCVGDQA